jgi:heme-degrading monooxygenase HmoA
LPNARTEEDPMIVRTWHGTAPLATAAAYHRHFTTNVAPHLKHLVGHQGAYLLRREVDGQVEFVALTLWDSIEAISRFAGSDPTVAIVEPEGRAALSACDEVARHYEVVFSRVGDG